MEKEEILSKSRNNEGKPDEYEDSISSTGSFVGLMVATILALGFFIFDIAIGKGQNYSYYAIIFGASASIFIYKGIKMVDKRNLLVGILQGSITLVAIVVHIILSLGI